MQHEIYAPALDTNSIMVTVENVRYPDCSLVEEGDELCTVSTPKASEAIVSLANGYLVLWAHDGEEWPVGSILASMYATESEAKEAVAKKTQKEEKAPAINATSKAKALAAQYGVDLHEIKAGGIIKEKDVQAFIEVRKNQ